MGDTTTAYVPRDYRRVCDQCGNLYNRSQLTRRRNWVFCDNCEDRGTRIIEEENEQIGRMRPFRILPVPNPKPLLIENLYDYVAEEGVLFDFILSTAPARNPGGASNPIAAAWAAVYLSDIMSQGTRPAVWIASAKTKIASLLTYLLTQQYGSPSGVACTAADPRLGGFLSGGLFLTSTVIAAGLAFTKGAAALGASSYLTAADRCATFIRRVQCGDLQVSQWTESPAGGSPYHVGGLATGVTDATGFQTQGFQLADVLGLSFLVALSAARGSGTSYGDAGATATFSGATAAPLSQMISELVTFAVVGPLDHGAGDISVTGLSPTKPQATYSSARHSAGGTASWTFVSTIFSVSIAQAIAGVFASNGAVSTVTAMLAWLAAGTANAANATPTTNTPQQTLDAITGTYSPATAPATSLTASAPFSDATGALYDLVSLGVLAPALSATNAAALRTARGNVSTGVPWSTFYLDLKYLGLLGRAGLSLQPHSAAGQSIPDVVFASQFGAVYRYSLP